MEAWTGTETDTHSGMRMGMETGMDGMGMEDGDTGGEERMNKYDLNDVLEKIPLGELHLLTHSLTHSLTASLPHCITASLAFHHCLTTSLAHTLPRSLRLLPLLHYITALLHHCVTANSLHYLCYVNIQAGSTGDCCSSRGWPMRPMAWRYPCWPSCLCVRDWIGTSPTRKWRLLHQWSLQESW